MFMTFTYNFIDDISLSYALQISKEKPTEYITIFKIGPPSVAVRQSQFGEREKSQSAHVRKFPRLPYERVRVFCLMIVTELKDPKIQSLSDIFILIFHTYKAEGLHKGGVLGGVIPKECHPPHNSLRDVAGFASIGSIERRKLGWDKKRKNRLIHLLSRNCSLPTDQS
uniref:Uncharacterized protein n=1 Tax=Glossina austeni TaxID=7395 RepID=A0A1A9UXU0_GLOAU